MRPALREHAAAALPPLLVLLLHARSVRFDFVWDDWFLVPIPAYLDADLLAVLTSPGNGVHYLPLRDLTLMLDTWLFGAWPGGFHLTNVVLFALAAWLVYHAYRTLFAHEAHAGRALEATPLALACALVFVAHPLQVEPVSFVSARNGLLALGFVLASWLAYARFLSGHGASAYALSILFTAAAMLSKQSAVTLPLLLLLLHRYWRKDAGWLAAARPLVPHFLIAMGLGVLHAGIARSAGIVTAGITPLGLLERIPRAIFVSEFYVFKFLWPTDLSIEYRLAPYLDHRILLAAATLLLGAAAVFVIARGWRSRSLSWLLASSYLAAVLPVANLLPTHPTVADRYAQIPLFALTPLLAVPLFARLRARARLLACAAVVAALSLASVVQSSVWRNDSSLFGHAVALDPEASQALGNLGMILWDRGRQQEALQTFALLHEMNPNDFRYHFALGMRAMERGHLAEGRRWLESASRGTGDSIFLVHMRLGELHLREGRRQDARESYERARALVSDQPFAREHRQTIERMLGWLD